MANTFCKGDVSFIRPRNSTALVIVMIHVFGHEINFDVILKYRYEINLNVIYVQVSDMLLPRHTFLLKLFMHLSLFAETLQVSFSHLSPIE